MIFRRYIFPIILIAAAVGLFYMYTDPTYQEIKEIRTDSKQYDEALERSRELISIRDELLNKYNNFESASLDRVKKLLPDNIDNVRLIIEINDIASQYGMQLEDVSLSQVQEEQSNNRQNNRSAQPQTQKDYHEMKLEFSVETTYNDFLAFIRDLEQSLRLIDVNGISFTAGNEEVQSYSVAITTYWLKDE